MKFIYEYKTKDNEQRSGEISAPSRDAVFRELKQQGIRPYEVVLAPGFANWVQSLGKRAAVIAVLAAAVIAFCCLWRGSEDRAAQYEDKAAAFNDKFEIKAALSRQVTVEEGDGIEVRQIKSTVEGMKEG